jgi:hypothetical protein
MSGGIVLRTEPNYTGIGSPLMAFAALLGAVVSIYNYITPLTGIDGTGGALLVIISSLLLLGAGIILSAGWVSGALRIILVVLSALGIIGTAFAAYLLESQELLFLMIVCALGWLIYLFQRRRRAPMRGAQ